MIEDKEIKKRELKDRIIVTADLDEKDAPRSRRRQNVNFFVERGRFILLLLALITAFTVVFALINRYKSYDKQLGRNTTSLFIFEFCAKHKTSHYCM